MGRKLSKQSRQLTKATMGPHFTEGARLLWLALEKRGLSQEAAGDQLALGRGVVNRWLYGTRRPEIDNAFKLEKAFGVPARAWSLAPTKPFEPPAAAPRTGTDDA